MKMETIIRLKIEILGLLEKAEEERNKIKSGLRRRRLQQQASVVNPHHPPLSKSVFVT